MCTNEFEFIEFLTYAAKPKDDIAKKCIVDFSHFIRIQDQFDIQKIENYIEKKLGGKEVPQKRKENSGFITNKYKEYLQHEERKGYDTEVMDSSEEDTGVLDEDTSRLNEYDDTGILEDTGILDDTGNLEYDDTGILEDTDNFEFDDTGKLNEDETSNLYEFEENTFDQDSEETGILNEEETTLLNQNQYTPHFPTLTRLTTNEVISINKPVFRIGKEKSYVDYFVSSNTAISRGHADIICRGNYNHYYVKDLNSKNKTFINNKILPPVYEVEIHDGDILKLANEEFIFHK